jgi:hypothetical protein
MSRVKFVSYDGAFPNLCSGTLILNVDGKNITFPDYCLSSGGNVSFDDEMNEEVTEGEWSISKFPESFPFELRQEATDIVNENVEYGCCGGCV